MSGSPLEDAGSTPATSTPEPRPAPHRGVGRLLCAGPDADPRLSSQRHGSIGRVDDDLAALGVRPGTLLVAGTALSDGVFDGTVILMLDADDSGSLGVIINRISDVDLDTALPGWSAVTSYPRVLFDGGPVSPEGAICLARPVSADEEPPGWRPLFERVGLLHLDTPLEIAHGAYSDLRIFAGYAGWAPGQLRHEISLGAWHVVPSRPTDPFDPDPTALWRRILRRQGGELGVLSTWTSRPELN